MKNARIKLTITRPDGHRSDVVVSGDRVTPLMLEVADELAFTLSTDKRAPKKANSK